MLNGLRLNWGISELLPFSIVTFSLLTSIVLALAFNADHDQPEHPCSLIMVCTNQYSVSNFSITINDQLSCQNIKIYNVSYRNLIAFYYNIFFWQTLYRAPYFPYNFINFIPSPKKETNDPVKAKWNKKIRSNGSGSCAASSI